MSATKDYVEDETTRPQPRRAVVDGNPALTYLQAKTEEDKAELTRELHDNLGGFIVAAMMDTGWIQGHWSETLQSQERLLRVREALSAAIDLKRRLIEELRPTLLDNFGLFAALKWHVKNWGDSAKAQVELAVPDCEPELPAATAIALFRFVQESLDVLLEHADAKSISLIAETSPTAIMLCISHDGQLDDTLLKVDMRLAAMKHRIDRLRGSLRVDTAAGEGGLLVAWVPLP